MKVCLVSLGCARTLVDSEVALGSLKKEGYQIVADVKNADVAIVNTCGFIQEAKMESIDVILQLCELKKKGKLSAVVALGCLAQINGQALRDEIKELDAVIGTDSFEKLPELLKPLRLKKKIYEVKAKPRYILNENSPRVYLTPQHYSYVKISEGCINACSYCVIPKMKGTHRSRPMESIIEEMKMITSQRPISEINLIGQDTAAYGFDWDRTFKLPELLRKIDAEKLAPWVRLLYAHPGHVSDELIDAIAESSSICKYVDFPVEHSHDDMLKRMNRGVTKDKMLWGIEALRKKISGVAIRTTIIVGFPGETEEEFKDLMDFLKEVRFERLGAFMYSDEEDARSFSMGDKIPANVSKDRFNAVMALQQTISQEINEAMIGKTLDVLVDEKDKKENDLFYGRTQADAPDVDGQVIITSKKALKPGDFVKVKINDALEYDLIGTC